MSERLVGWITIPHCYKVIYLTSLGLMLYKAGNDYIRLM